MDRVNAAFEDGARGEGGRRRAVVPLLRAAVHGRCSKHRTGGRRSARTGTIAPSRAHWTGEGAGTSRSAPTSRYLGSTSPDGGGGTLEPEEATATELSRRCTAAFLSKEEGSGQPIVRDVLRRRVFPVPAPLLPTSSSLGGPSQPQGSIRHSRHLFGPARQRTLRRASLPRMGDAARAATGRRASAARSLPRFPGVRPRAPRSRIRDSVRDAVIRRSGYFSPSTTKRSDRSRLYV